MTDPQRPKIAADDPSDQDRQDLVRVNPVFLEPEYEDCPDCDGVGEVQEATGEWHSCDECDGSGEVAV